MAQRYAVPVRVAKPSMSAWRKMETQRVARPSMRKARANTHLVRLQSGPRSRPACLKACGAFHVQTSQLVTTCLCQLRPKPLVHWPSTSGTR